MCPYNIYKLENKNVFFQYDGIFKSLFYIIVHNQAINHYSLNRENLINCLIVNNYSSDRNKYNFNVLKFLTYTENGFVSNEEFLPFMFVINLTIHLFSGEPPGLAYYRFMQFSLTGLLL